MTEGARAAARPLIRKKSETASQKRQIPAQDFVHPHDFSFLGSLQQEKKKKKTEYFGEIAEKREEIIMTKWELLSYLREVRDTEHRRIDCRNQISALRGQLSHYTAPSVPALNTPWKLPSRSIEDEVRSYIDSKLGERLGLFGMGGFIVGFIIALPNIFAGFLFAIPGIILGVLVGALTMKPSAWHHVKRQRAKQAREADRQAKGIYKQARAEYPKKMREYLHSVESCEKQIRELEDQLQSVEKHLSRLYAKRLLQPEFLNYQSVNFIYSLLETGICSSLEGPDGAYAYCRAEMKKR